MNLVALCLSFVAACDAPRKLELVSPQERQVFQRDQYGKARVVVAGRCSDELKAIGVTVYLADRTSLAWRSLALTDVPGPLHEFHGEIEVPEGGWHKLAIELRQSHTYQEPVGVDIGVGEVFVIAGQSNSANFGEERFPALDDRVSAFDGKRWSLAADPMPGVQDGSQDGSPWPLFGKLMRESLDVPIGIASTGFGGTTIGEWQPNTKAKRGGYEFELYAGLRDRVRALGDVRAILWHQGESDAERNTTRDEYVARFEKLASQLDADTGAKHTWITARATFQPMTPPARMEIIRSAQTLLWERGLALRGPDTDDMLGTLRHSTDHVHFNRAGLEEHARRWHASVIVLLKSKTDAPAETKR
ncbi:MAG: sialate O-acetylesterase [Planctomycetota bacterium]